MAAITGDTTAIYTKDASQTIYDSQNNVYSITVKPLKQKQDDWQTALPITLGGVSSNDKEHWIDKPGANGQCRIVYTILHCPFAPGLSIQCSLSLELTPPSVIGNAVCQSSCFCFKGFTVME